MKTKPIDPACFIIALLSFIFLCNYKAVSQKDMIELTFTAVNNSNHVQLDSIKVINKTENGDTVLYWPDTVLSLYYVGIPEANATQDEFQVFQNYPNPVKDQAILMISIPEKENVKLLLTDLQGRTLTDCEKSLDRGTHSFRFVPGDAEIYIFTAEWKGVSKSIKIISPVSGAKKQCTLDYIGSEDLPRSTKSLESAGSFIYGRGDELLCIGYANGKESGTLDAPESDMTFTFQFATNIPCPGLPTVEYGGQVYNTIQVYSQCWMKENLNIGTMLNGELEMTDNGTIEKFCYMDDPDSCSKYGGLYQWWEAVQYSNQPGAKGICPPGWHVPRDEEYKILEGAVDSQYGIGDPEWDGFGVYAGLNAGLNLKATAGWMENGNGLDTYGFAALPGGERLDPGYFSVSGIVGSWWNSDEFTSGYTAMSRILIYNQIGTFRANYNEYWGFSVRCLRD